MGNRLADYYLPSYLNAQVERGSIISRAILKHGIDAFSLSVLVLGPTPSTDTVFSATNLPDYVLLEQTYLDSYTLLYNVNRFASSSAYNPSLGPVNVGEDNPSFGKVGSTSFA